MLSAEHSSLGLRRMFRLFLCIIIKEGAKNMKNPIKDFSKREWILWLSSLMITFVANLFSTDSNILALMASIIGVTSLIFAANDVVLIILWSLASLKNPVYISVIVIFVIFFINDIYGFISWKKRELQTDMF